MGWLLFTTLVLGFYMAWNIGANDVANAMGTSVGSKALTLRRAVVLAAVLEFSGAFLIGSSVSETIQHGIVTPQIFEGEPMSFVLGMMGSLFATGALLQLASYFGLPISTTHAIVGAVLGFGICFGGIGAVQWSRVIEIALSWILSPLLSGLAAYFLFLLIQRKILHVLDPLRAARKWSPLFVFFCFFIASISFLYQGLKQLNLHFSFLLAFSFAVLIGGLASLFSQWLLLRTARFATIESVAIGHLQQDLGVEKIFIYLQILSACLVAFAHGANDVANAIGPVAAVIGVLKTNSLGTQTQIPPWLLALGGGGIVLGLATWGWRVIETIGKKITELTPTRGFCAELGAAVTILCASKLGLPISTTHALVGAIFGVGIARGVEALNFQTLKEIVLSWIVTIPLCALFSIISFYILRFIYYTFV
jgi:phosphate/sulfate permease